MSCGITFGSVGDFVAVAALIRQIVSSLQDSGGSASDYQELFREVDGLQCALDEIEHLEGKPEQMSANNGIRFAALNCQCSLSELQTKLKWYGSSVGVRRSGSRLQDIGKRLKWQLKMKDEAKKLRAFRNGAPGEPEHAIDHVGAVSLCNI